MTQAPDSGPLGTVEKAVDILFHLHAAAAPCGVTHVGRALGLPKSSTHRLLGALLRRGLVERDDRGRYRPGIGLVALGLGALGREPIVAAARPVLESEAAALGETVFLVAARAGRLIVLDEVEGTGFLRAMPRVGEAVPLHATAVGKLHLAFASDAAALAPPDFERFTPNTLRDAAALAAEVALARQRGTAHNVDEWIEGLSVVAAPILMTRVMAGASSPTLAGALAFALPSARLRALGGEALDARAIAAADRIAARLEGRREPT